MVPAEKAATGKLKLYVIANSNGAVTNGTITTGDTAVYSGAFAARNGDTAVKAITINVEAGKTYKVSSQVMLFRAELTPTGSTETSTETTTTTTTETSTETTTMGVLKVMVNNPASSKISTVEVTVKRNGKAVSGVTALNIGSATEIAGVNEDDVITFTFAKEQAKQITNWDSNLKSVFRDKTYTLTYTVGKTVATPTMDYYDSMPAAVSLGQSTTTAAGYGTYGFGQYKVQTNGNDLAKYAIIRGHQYSLLDVGSGDYDKDGTEFGIPDERVLLLGGTDDEIELTNSIDSSEKVLVLLDCSGDTDSSLTTSDKVAYFAELVSVSAGHRYYAYPYTLYAGATQRAYDTNPKGTRIEISNKQ